MKEMLDIRLSEDWAKRHLPDGVGQPMRIAPLTGDVERDEEIQRLFRPLTRQLVIESTDPIVGLIKQHSMRFDSCPGAHPLVYSSVGRTRQYIPQEKNAARAFQLFITAFFEPAGVDCGTEYDYSSACPTCGFGRIRRGELTLDLSRVPRRSGLARTIAWDEWIISRQLADSLKENSISGWEAKPVYKRKGVAYEDWFELVVTGRTSRVSSKTETAIDFFHDDVGKEYVCPQHGWLGRWLKSELMLVSDNLQSDLAVTEERVGVYGGVLFPPQLIVASPRALEVLEASKVKGFRWERVLFSH